MINRLISEIKAKDAPIVVGLDPMLSYIPKMIKETAINRYGETPKAAGEAVFEYNKQLIDGISELVPAVKPQIAMYEQFGIPGLRAFEKTCTYAKQKGLIVIGDVKRGDIGSTSGAYAIAHGGHMEIGSKRFRAFEEDFATVNPYLGSDGIEPFLNVCRQEKTGIFVLAKTSNPSSGEFQDQQIDGKPLYEMVAEKIAAWGETLMGETYSYVGAVVGATYPQVGRRLRKIMPKTYILVPGYGAQGGRGRDLTPFFNEDGLGAIVNSSRGIICAYQQEQYNKYKEEGFVEAARAAVLDMKEDLKEAYIR